LWRGYTHGQNIDELRRTPFRDNDYYQVDGLGSIHLNELLSDDCATKPTHLWHFQRPPVDKNPFRYTGRESDSIRASIITARGIRSRNGRMLGRRSDDFASDVNSIGTFTIARQT